MSELDGLDALVSEYLLFRSFKQTQQQLNLDKKTPQRSESNRQQRAVVQRITKSLDAGDYPLLISLWDSYIVQKIGTVKSISLNTEARDAEFLCHICLAIYPFRSEVISSAPSPSVAARVAARSMTIFKHYLETRGARLIQKDEQFSAYRNLYRIAFPPTHPQFKHLFADGWLQSARDRILTFLEKFFVPTETPVLCQLYQTLGSRSESELKAVFKRRERKLLKFARSIYSLSNDLLTALEEGKTIDKGFLVNFRAKFDTFSEVLQPENTPDGDEDDDSASSSPVGVNMESAVVRNKGLNNSKNVSLQHSKGDDLDLNCAARDVSFAAYEVSEALDGLLTRDLILTSSDAAVVCQTATQGCLLLRSLNHFILRPDKEMQPQTARDSVVTSLCNADILGLRPPTSNSSMNNGGGQGQGESAVGGLEQVMASGGGETRSLTRFLSSLAQVLKRISPPDSPRSSASSSLSPQQAPPYERLLTTAEIMAEYVCRLITALGASPSGLVYMQISGMRLTASLVELLAALPTISSTSTTVTNLYVFGAGDGDDEHHLANIPRSGTAICTWCIMALTSLMGQCKPHQLLLLKRGGVVWLSRALGHFVSDVQRQVYQGNEDEEVYLDNGGLSSSSHTPSPVSLFEMCLSLLSIVLQSSEAQRSLVVSLNMQRETEALVSSLVLLALRIDVNEDHAQSIVEILRVLFQEPATRQVARELKEVSMLRRTLAEGTAMGIGEAAAQELLDAIDLDETNQNEALGGSGPGASSSGVVDVAEIMATICSVQTLLPENQSLERYIDSSSSSHNEFGFSFLFRYSKQIKENKRYIFKGTENFNDSIEINRSGRKSPVLINLASPQIITGDASRQNQSNGKGKRGIVREEEIENQEKPLLFDTEGAVEGLEDVEKED